ncbi:hypothetical protein ACM6RM_22120 [Streptomyces pratensis]
MPVAAAGREDDGRGPGGGEAADRGPVERQSGGEPGARGVVGEPLDVQGARRRGAFQGGAANTSAYTCRIPSACAARSAPSISRTRVTAPLPVPDRP